ncbi:conidial pigment polyketide synthase PksP/Alb1 [Talaromyces stipitatus ATCC 10500]|uniref:Conidial pigment polyketide synthase PksP/Alb1 n=1 Tax=Talaromyces stipitatus (strain ATCC 10500 / CBS 375.48 / QM 6759 / NRRL 1006) TaxID=441959 RepID=B8MBM6_TALSN|nr:conidial pigment polyketide synthase PksP/Alb1 [Talaromyces stipitatus ATCC 10500]EED17890.1 conidial pigment polyketide synthase PksP/Alb1 [Talaromyces stipitatus ATCC 10500]
MRAGMGSTSWAYVFGDQTSEFDSGLRRLLQAKGNTFVTSFLERCSFALRHEVTQLPPSDRRKFPRFTSITSLLSRYRESGPNPALESALTIIYQLGSFISYYGDGGQIYPVGSESYVIGLCTGLLASAAIASSRTIGELIPLAVEAVVVALRLGLCAYKVRNYVGQYDGRSQSWSAVISGVSEERALALITEFGKKKGLSPSSRPYVSAVSYNGLTISAPPLVLEELIDSELSKHAKPLRVAVHAPFHAPHLYGQEDVEWALNTTNHGSFKDYCSRIPVLSSTTGYEIAAESFEDLLRVAVEEILLKQLCWDKVLDGYSSIIKGSSVSTCTIFPVATSASSGLVSALKRAGISEVLLENTLSDSTKPGKFPSTTGRTEQSKIAIIGLSGRFPDAPSPEHFWDILYQGLDVHREVPPDRWNWKTHVDLTGKKRNTSQVPYGCWIPEPGLFDPRFFNMSPREALQADPGQRLALVTAYEALEMAGFVPDSTPSTQKDRVGIFYGITSDDYREINSGQDIDTYFIPGGNRAFTPGRINYHFKFSGPSVSVDTACSSSLAAIHMACNALWRNDCDAAIAGGTNILTNPDNHAGLDRGHFLSRTGNCNTFDDAADGYCRADGVGTVVLKRLEDAIADNDPIQAVIAGAYTNHSAEAVSMTRPHVGAQAFIFDKLLNEADVHPNDVSYIEMHGTGTQAGDAVEMKSVLDTFAPDHGRKPEQTLHLGSAKSNIGHGESASGVASLIKVLLMMRKSTIPPHCGIKTKINQNFPTDLKERNVHIAFKPTPWVKPESGLRRCFLNNFSAAGGNTALLLEDAPNRQIATIADPRSMFSVAVSARCQASLKNNIKNLSDWIEKHSSDMKEDEFLAKLSYTTTARRIHHPFRIMVSGTKVSEVQEALRAAASRETISTAPSVASGAGFVFTGQGAQYTNMGKQLFEGFLQFRSDVLRFNGIAQSQGFPSFVSLIDGSVPIEEFGPVITQLGTTCMQMAIANLWISWDVRPTFVMGHSLGEYAALYVSGALTAFDAIYLCGRRAQLLEEKCKVGTHAMLAVRSGLSEITPFLNPGVHEVACINAPGETVISATSQNIDALAEQLVAAGIKATKLKVPFAFHSSQVEPILEELTKVTKGVKYHKPSIPLVSPLLGEVINEKNYEQLSGTYLSRHCRETVNFLAAIEASRHAKLMTDKTVWIEIGSHTVCSGMIKSTLGPQANTVASLRRNEDTWKVLSQSLTSLYIAGIDIQWKEYYQDFKSSHEVLHLPAYSWDNKNYWIDYKNDFCLTKGGDPVPQITSPAPSHLTISAQKIVKSIGEANKATVITETDISDPRLCPVIQGHKVNGTPLCPSSLYADIAQTLAEYLIVNFKPELKGVGLDVADMAVPKPLIYKNAGPQLFRAAATADWDGRQVSMQIYSVTPEGKKMADHASCIVKFFDVEAAQEEWKRNAYLIHRSVDRLFQNVANGDSNKLGCGMVYKLFGALVDYDKNYKSMRDVILDSDQYEATALVKFQAEKANFHRNPFWIDSIGHITGFTMNANDATDSANFVYVNHGWDSMRCATKFSADATYRTYVRMQPWQGTIYSGDVYVFEENEIIAVYGGVKFQGVPRKILNTVLPPPGGTAQVTKPATKGPVPVPVTVPKTKPIAKAVKCSAPKTPAPSVLVQAFKILASEVGLSEAELSDDLVFSDYGVDSLLALTITGKFREELNLDLESSIFMDYPTVKDFKGLLMQSATPVDSSESSSESSVFDDSGLTEPPTPGTPGDYPPPMKVAPSLEEDKTLATIRQTLIEEIGVSAEELTGEANLSEMGMDSLLSLTVLGRLREALGLDLPSEFFIENPTMGQVGEALDLKPKAPIRQPKSAMLSTSAPLLQPEDLSSKLQHPPATSILLQGNPKTAKHTLFLFPDGSGSSTSYATLPKISADVCVYGLNCPYMKTPEKLNCALQDLTASYVAEMRRRQPKGPYNVGGWSAGGISAYDAVRQLVIEQGETVERIFFLDSPFPIGLEKLPPRLYKFFDDMKIFGDGKAPPPKWLLPHFLAFIDALDMYEAVPFPSNDPKYESRLPKAYLVWAKDGVCGKPSDPRPAPSEDGSHDPREMLWLLNDRTDFGPNGWDTLVGKHKVASIEALHEANHFTMMDGSKAGGLSSFIKNAF